MNPRTLTLIFLGAATLAQPQGGPITLVKLKGWVDLHAHPASHLAFGSDEDGDGGIFWGKPGKKLETSRATVTTDMPACSFKHGGSDGDLVRHETHKGLMGQLDAVTEYPHQTADFGENNFGAPTYQHWPHARSISHQQMHITSIRRAYDGGQRVMVASTTDNEFLSSMWTKIGYNAFGNPVPAIDPDFGYDSARRQIAFIKSMAAANATWMEIAYDAEDLRRIVLANKLALILSLEMDSLTPAQILNLVTSHGVRHVIPIHLINNRIGGPAVYNDAFNAVNNFVNGGRNGGHLNNDAFFKVMYDPLIGFRLGRPMFARPEGNNLVSGGAIHLDPIPMNIYEDLGYQDPEAIGGHRNQLGLTTQGRNLLKTLAKMGVLIDVAHMSYRATDDTLDLAEAWKYPIINSHTGLRDEDNTAINERALAREHAARISALGGMIGLGTEGTNGIRVLRSNMKGDPLFRFRSTSPERTWTLPQLAGNPYLSHLVLRIKTGNFTLPGNGNDVFARFTIDGHTYSRRLNVHKEGWREGLVVTVPIELPEGTRSSELSRLSLLVPLTGMTWDLDELEIRALPKEMDTVGTWLAELKDLLEIMKGGRVALGTDINGFAPQLAIAGDNVQFPIRVAQEFLRPNAPSLQPDKMGTRFFDDFKNEGIAHYGLLPDFLQAVSQKPDSDDALKALFYGADNLWFLWRRCELAGGNID